MKKKNFIIFTLALLIISVCYFSVRGIEPSGTDDQAIETITKINNGYKPWAKNVWEPNENIENLLFGLQASIGACFVGFYVIRKIRCSEKSQPSQK